MRKSGTICSAFFINDFLLFETPSHDGSVRAYFRTTWATLYVSHRVLKQADYWL